MQADSVHPSGQLLPRNEFALPRDALALDWLEAC
jgi:hypothetical protein